VSFDQWFSNWPRSIVAQGANRFNGELRYVGDKADLLAG
jgi:hypothetical protein